MCCWLFDISLSHGCVAMHFRHVMYSHQFLKNFVAGGVKILITGRHSAELRATNTVAFFHTRFFM